MPEVLFVFMLGVLNGLTVCSVSCVPYLAPYLIGVGNGFREGVSASLLFVSAKVLTYACFCAAAALIGHVVHFGESSNLVIGIILIAAGLSIPWASPGLDCKKSCRQRAKKSSLFALGVSSSIIPCPPLLAVFALAAKQESVLAGASCGLIYGLGLMLTPLIIVGGGLSFASSGLRERLGADMRYVEYGIVLMLICSGVLTILS